MKRILFIIQIIILGIHAFPELKYIEIDSKQNLPMIRIKTVDDFEAIIKAYDISLIFLQSDSYSKPGSSTVPKSSDAFVIAGNTYFIFSLEGYKTLADYKKGKSEGYKNPSDYEKAKQLGIENGEFFYYCERNSFTNLEDAEDAYKNGFVLYSTVKKQSSVEKMVSPLQSLIVFNENPPKNKESEAYYGAKELGYVNYVDYKDYLDYTSKGFKTKEDSQIAENNGFEKGDDYYNAKEKGIESYDDYELTNFSSPIKSEYTLSEKSDVLNFICPIGTNIYAAMSGKVTSIGYDTRFGNYVIVTHNSRLKTIYGNMSSTRCKKGTYITEETKIGSVGSTGDSKEPHLGFQILRDEQNISGKKLMEIFKK
ncbi:M23 family metallopeptidase [Treponema ruminis]|uniref:M23ase beta-sheet core domain-containing protein n=1 Tax=Treponema ruminis TaxID=744515 RepID=A0A7W8LKU9_9SPIR|nr:M23 family metallopeptidase [Treponema ruminis]MBB5224734.1 hypothetical protein [Treponema ruminis]